MDIPMMPSPDGLPKDDGQRKADQAGPATYMHDKDREGLQRMELEERTQVPPSPEEARAIHSKPADLDSRIDPTDRGIVASGNFDEADNDALLRHQNPRFPEGEKPG